MATVTPSQAFHTLTSPSSAQGDRGMWEYAVPLDHDENNHNNASNAPKAANSTYDSSITPAGTQYSRQPLTSQPNAITSQARATTGDHDSLGRSKMNTSRTKINDSVLSSELESYAEPFRTVSNGASRQPSYGSLSKASRKGSAQIPTPISRSQDEDESNWIHRDKLAQIESKELEEAGLRVGRRPSERSDAFVRDKRQRLASPVRLETDLDESSLYDVKPVEEEVAVPAKSFIPKPAATRPGGSRIPVPRSVSSSIGQADRDFPPSAARNRADSNGWTAAGGDQSPQSQPGSQHSVKNDGYDDTPPPDTPPRRTDSSNAISSDRLSPKKLRNPVKTTPNGKKQQTSVLTATTAAGRPPSMNSKSRNATPAKLTPEPKRPGTSNGLGARPSTASHRPEGDPPWIATMYKPDPRLPPDQQMLPTHAKRLAQEQWEKEGKTGTAYDREFRLLNTEAFPENTRIDSPTKIEPADPPPQEDVIRTTILTAKWPNSATPPLGSPMSQTSFRPGTSGTDRINGGYKTMPTITKSHSPAIHSPALPVQPMRLPEPMEPEEGKKEKNGCCASCVVM